MRTYILRRLLQIVPTVLMITLVVFVMMRSIPGDPVVALLGDAYTEEDAIKAREAYGLDKPAAGAVRHLARQARAGRLGRLDPHRAPGAAGRAGPPAGHARADRPLDGASRSSSRFPPRIIGALRQNTWADYTATSVAMIGVSIPEFFIGVLLLLVFSIGLGGAAAELGLGLPAGHLPQRWCAA